MKMVRVQSKNCLATDTPIIIGCIAETDFPVPFTKQRALLLLA
jgi:hypothetical protein